MKLNSKFCILTTIIFITTINSVQANINITGRILDSNNKPITNTKIYVNSINNTNPEITTTTDNKGNYNLEITPNCNLATINIQTTDTNNNTTLLPFLLSLINDMKYKIDIKIAKEKSTISSNTFDVDYLNKCYKQIEQLKNKNSKTKQTDKIEIEQKIKICNLITPLIQNAKDFENLFYLSSEYFDAIGHNGNLITTNIDSNIVLDMIAEIPMNSNLYNDTNIFYAIIAESMFNEETPFNNNKIDAYLSANSKKDNSKFIELLANYATKIKDTKNANKYKEMLKK